MPASPNWPDGRGQAKYLVPPTQTATSLSTWQRGQRLNASEINLCHLSQPGSAHRSHWFSPLSHRGRLNSSVSLLNSVSTSLVLAAITTSRNRPINHVYLSVISRGHAIARIIPNHVTVSCNYHAAAETWPVLINIHDIFNTLTFSTYKLCACSPICSVQYFAAAVVKYLPYLHRLFSHLLLLKLLRLLFSHYGIPLYYT